MNKVVVEMVQKLAELEPVAYDRVRLPSAEGLDIRPETLDLLIKEHRRKFQNNNSMPYEDVYPWHSPISPHELLDEITITVKRFIVCQNETAIATTLWIAMTWFIDVIDVAPLAVITAPEKRCGKSQLLSLLSRLTYRAISASNITPAALFRCIDLWHPTLLIDEADTFMRENEELRGIINCGHTRENAKVVRTVGKEFTVKSFYVWGAKALAGIGKLSDTIMDRAIPLILRRKKNDEHVDRLRHAEPDLFPTLASKLARFSQDYSESVRAARPRLPASLHDREQDNWEPLLAIASVAGDVWLQRAVHAAQKISGISEQSTSIGVELLTDLECVIDNIRSDRISTADLLAGLCKDQEKLWATYNRGTQMTARQLSNRLREFGIVSNTIRFGSTTAKGYMFADFGDAFNRYLPSTTASSVTASQTTDRAASSVT